MRRAGASDALSLKFSSLSRTLKFQSTLEPEAGQADFPLTVDNKPLQSGRFEGFEGFRV